MAVELNQFWALLTDSKLLEPAIVGDLANRFAAAQASVSEKPVNSKTLAKWLVKQKVLTPFQANILVRGSSGPFRFGNYLLTERMEGGPLGGAYTARHRQSGHLVLLQFQPGTGDSDLETWRARCQLADKLADVRSQNLVSVYQTLVLPKHRLVVSQIPYGKPLSGVVPVKSRMRWQEACRIVGQAAIGLALLHKHGVIHNAVSSRTIWVATNHPAQIRLQIFPDLEFESTTGGESNADYIAPELRDDTKLLPDSRSEIYALGSTLYRVIAGRMPFASAPDRRQAESGSNSRPRSLKKYEVPEELDLLVARMLATDPAARFSTMEEVVEKIAAFAGDRLFEQADNASLPATLDAFEDWLHRSGRIAVAPFGQPAGQIENAPAIDTGQARPAIQLDQQAVAPAIAESPNQPAHGRTRLAWVLPAAILLTTAAGLLVGLLLLNMEKSKPSEIVQQPTEPVSKTDSNQNSHSTTNSSATESSGITQQLIADDGQTLWETPTTGPPIDFNCVPPAPKIIFVFRLSEIVENAEGKLLIQSLGPGFSQSFQSWTQRYDIEPGDVQRLIVSLHSTPSFEYLPFYVIEFREPVPTDRWMQVWGNPLLQPDTPYYAADGGSAFCFLNAENQPLEPGSEAAKQLLIGPKELMDQAIRFAGPDGFSGPMKNMVPWTDSDRLATILFQRNALFNDEGKKLMSGILTGLNRQLSVMMDEGIRGGVFCLHLDDGTYLELRFDRTLDLTASDLQDSLQANLRDARDRIFEFVQRVPANEFWDKIRLRYDNMLSDLYRNTRINIEDRDVIANCWLAPMAAHNIAAATELVLTFSDSASGTPPEAANRRIPETIEELLATPRDLTVSTQPDLILLINSLQNEIRDDYGSLPFPFEIRLMGSDLGKEGITQNQRPNDFEMKQKPLAEILTEIMVQANPDRNISGPSDPNCKLIWVIAEDPKQPTRRIILVTTRKAAAENSYELPNAFRSE